MSIDAGQIAVEVGQPVNVKVHVRIEHDVYKRAQQMMGPGESLNDALVRLLDRWDEYKVK